MTNNPLSNLRRRTQAPVQPPQTQEPENVQTPPETPKEPDAPKDNDELLRLRRDNLLLTQLQKFKLTQDDLPAGFNFTDEDALTTKLENIQLKKQLSDRSAQDETTTPRTQDEPQDEGDEPDFDVGGVKLDLQPGDHAAMEKQAKTLRDNRSYVAATMTKIQAIHDRQTAQSK